MLEKLNLGKQGADLCSSSVTQLFVAAYFARADWRGYLAELQDLYRRRRDVMLEALAEHFGGEPRWTHAAGRALHLGDAADYIDTTDLLARSATASRSCPGRAAYMDGRAAALLDAAELRGLTEHDIREGVRRIGEIMGGDTACSAPHGLLHAPRRPRRRRPQPGGRAADGRATCRAAPPETSARAAGGSSDAIDAPRQRERSGDAPAQSNRRPRAPA